MTKPLCPECRLDYSRVVDSRGSRRRRECTNPDCQARFTTYEQVARISRNPKHRPKTGQMGLF